MIYKKHSFHATLFSVLLCGAPFAALHAQNPGGQPRPPHEPPPSPLFDALDTNHDGVISADEIANASTALKALLKDGATQITREDVRPPRPTVARDDKERDDQMPRPHPGAESFRPHQPPPMDDRAADNDRPPRFHDDADRDDHPFHRPAPRRAPEDEQPAADERARPLPPAADRDDHPPRPPEDAGQDAEGFRRPRPFHRDPEERPEHRHPQGSPLFDALDTNHDGVISADEIANAPEVLKKLDKSGSGQIRREDLKPLPPPDKN